MLMANPTSPTAPCVIIKHNQKRQITKTVFLQSCQH